MPNADDFILAAPNRRCLHSRRGRSVNGSSAIPRQVCGNYYKRRTKDVSTEAVQFPGKCQQIQHDFYDTVHWFSLWREKVSSETRKRHTRAIRKNEARILGKVILDTWRFILGYIAKYRWILFRGSFLLSDSVLLCVFSWTHRVRKRQTSPSQKGQERQLKQCHSKASDNWFSMTSASLPTDSVYEEERCIVKSGKVRQTTGTWKFPYKGI